MALDVEHVEGPRVDRAELLDTIENDNIEPELYHDDAQYFLRVAGIGSTEKEMQESIKRRKG